MSFLDKLKHKADEMGLKEKADHLAEEAKKMAEQAKEKAGDLAAENKDKVESVLDKAGAKIDEKTEGKYSDKIAKAKEQVAKGVDKIAEGGTHSTPTTEGGTTGTGSAGTTFPGTGAGAGAAAGAAAAAGAGAAGAAPSDGLLGDVLADEEEVAEEVLSVDDVDPEAPLDSSSDAELDPDTPRPQRLFDDFGEPVDELPEEPDTTQSSGSW
jgi:hypothetical protein